MKLLLFYITTFCAFVLSISFLSAQTLPAPNVPSSYIMKYDTSFNGIGPKVYLLPAPRSKIEILQDQVDQITAFSDTIKNIMLIQDLLIGFTNARQNSEMINLLNINQVNLNNLSSYLMLQNEHKDDAIGLLNEIAKIYMHKHEFSKAEDLLQEGINLINNNDKSSNIDILKKNLIGIYIHNGEYTKAKQLTEEFINKYKQNKSSTERAEYLVTLAKIQALTKNLEAAEKTILRKALPIFDSNKDYSNKIKAWIALAQLYILNERYPEAQWFLIQAQEVAVKKNISQYNSMIEYLLGSSKFYQENLVFAKKELEKAFQLATEADDKHLQLAISQLLAAANVKLKDTDETEHFLKSYWKLRNELF